MTTHRLILGLLLGAPFANAAAPVQLAAPNDAGVAMGHLHYAVRDMAANRDLWLALGGEPAGGLGSAEVIRFPGILVVLEPAESPPPTGRSLVDHVAFRVRSLEAMEAAGLAIERLEGFVGIASVYTPEGERVELFDETATNVGFTVDGGGSNPVAERHNRPITAPIVTHHVHLYVPEGAAPEAKEWYARLFGGVPGVRWRYDAVDLPGININFSGTTEARTPTRGHVLDHIGFEVDDLQAFCERLEADGVELDEPYTPGPSGVARALLTDPWGTRIELTEGLDGR